MLLSVLSTEYDARAIERRLGFHDVYAVLNDAGGERFGAVQLTGGGLSGLMRLRGLNYWLGNDEAEREALARIQQHLPDFPVQFIIQRRRLDSGAYLAKWRKRIAHRFVEQPEAGEQVWADFKERMVARWREYGAAEVWCGLALTASSEAELGQRLAQLYTSLPFEAEALGAAEIVNLLRNYLRPASPASKQEADTANPLSIISPNGLYLSNDGIRLERNTSLSFYTAQPPTPAAPSGEWLWPVLRSDALAGSEYDLCVHIQPARYEMEMQMVLERRLTHIEARLTEIEALTDDAALTLSQPLPEGEGFVRRGDKKQASRLQVVYSHPELPASDAERESLLLERHEVEQRLAQLRRSEERLREVSMLFILRAAHGQEAAQRNRFIAELERLGFSPQQLKGRQNVERGLRSSLPINRNQAGRQFTITAAAAAPLLWLANNQPSDTDQPPLGLARDRSVVGFAPQAEGEPGHRTISGGSEPQRSYIIHQWALLDYVASHDLYGYDPNGEWREFCAALGGVYIAPGALTQGGNLNLIAAARAELDDPASFTRWVVETAGLLSKLAGGLDDDQISHLSAALFQLGLGYLERNQPLTLQRLYADVRAGGYTPLARALNIIARGRWRALFADEQPKMLGKSATSAPSPAAPLVFIGRADHDTPPELAAYLANLAARRLLTALLNVAPGVAMPGFPGLRHPAAPTTMLFAAAPAALDEAALSRAISRALATQQPPVSLWLLAAQGDDLLADPANVALLSCIPNHLLLRQDGSAELAALAGLSERAARAIPNLAKNQALLAQPSGSAIVNIVLSFPRRGSPGEGSWGVCHPPTIYNLQSTIYKRRFAVNIVRPNFNLRRPATASDDARRKKWLMLGGYAAVALFLLIALVLISRARSGNDTAQPAAFVSNGRGGMSALATPFSQPQTNQAANGASSSTASAAASSSGDPDRPSGPPTDPSRSDWRIVKDYAANGGGGDRGAVDISFAQNVLGSPLHATHTGLVKTLRDDPSYGNLVYVIGSGYTTIYGHLQSISVSDGQTVRRGDLIGTLGVSGATTGPEVNYQVWQCSGDPKASGTAARTCVNRNPADYLK
jgi:murein DD-endopeptidase MepM/ murein hydrolase activator NlpD